MSNTDKKIEDLMEKNYYQFFYEPSPFVEDTLKNMISIYESDGYPQSWNDLGSHLNFT
jgi:hypothetical protein